MLDDGVPLVSPIRREENHIEIGASWDDLVERKIREAQEQGAFDNLPGQGRPLRIEKNPYARDWELAYKILKDNDFAPPWVEASRLMVRALDAVRNARSGGPSHDRPAARRAHLALVEDANRRIDRFNLLVPFPWLQRARLSWTAEAARFDAAWPE
jgi:DnaJ family protein C protein 28